MYSDSAVLSARIVIVLQIPSMYLFLFIYSIFNLNVVSWGTREVKQKKSAEELEAEAAMAEEKAQAAETKARQQSGTIWGRLTGGGMSKLSLFSRTEQGLREDLNKIQDGIGEKMGMLVRFVVTFFGSIIYPFTQNWLISLVISSVLPLLAIFGGLMGAIMTKVSKVW